MSRIERRDRSESTDTAPVRGRGGSDKPPVDPEHARRSADAQAEARRNRLFSEGGGEARRSKGAGTCGGPVPLASVDSRAAANAAAAHRSQQEGIAAVVHPERKPTSMNAVAAEVLRLRAKGAKTSDPQLTAAIGARANTLSTEWCRMAREKGMKPPSESFDPFRASDDELRSAILWTEVGNAFPVHAFKLGNNHYQAELAQAYAVRSPMFLAQLVDASKERPERLMPLLQRDLLRLGDKMPCSPNDTLQTLLERHGKLQRAAEMQGTLRAEEEERKRVTIGLDGRIGTTEAVVGYEMDQRLLAANPGTALGAIAAGIVAASGGDVEAIRAAGSAGNMAETIGALGTAPDLSHLGVDSPFRWGFAPAPKPMPRIQ